MYGQKNVRYIRLKIMDEQANNEAEIINNNEQHDNVSNANASVPTTPTIVNIGLVKTFRMMKEILGGYDNVGASKQDFKIFHIDLKAFIQGSDAQMYNMVFTPFTEVDHHKSCITFAAGFIAKKDIESFEWLFKTFLKAMGNNEPNCLITDQDQDPAMKVAISRVFQKSEHRFCMWHIMKKLPDKVGRAITKEETGFLKKICACVWHLEIEPDEFEERWNKVMVEFELEGNEWLCYMYEIRDKWIPTYFRDVFLGGIMRTTSRSESENNFFCSFINPHVSLVEFYMRYEAAINAQRHTQGQNDNDSKHKYPECKTPLGIEKYASTIYTISVFYDFQYEVEMACFSCGCEEFKRENGLEIAKVSEGGRSRTFDVVFNPTNQETTCSCKLFNRWTTMATKRPIFDLGGNLLEQCANIDKKKLLNKLWSEIHNCVSLAEGDDDDIKDLVINFRGLRLDLEAKRNARSNGERNATNKEKDIELLIGASVPTEISIKPPKISKNKGTGVHLSNTETRSVETSNVETRSVETSNVETRFGSGKRLKGDKEKEVEQNQKKRGYAKVVGN
ncbi:protein FAR1-RELATED SEQUENCE 1-like [Chenopodium quinoa]|uniref:protein FAR1-RELATED SEQUENCE 1-like n=1 Tax=Chenopodium quinoa TaxID=63459 RepID=UPI000B789E92|nr:protein FAR1-RELATED SEQUENCE 1-like [Chenopodium quinoa]